MCRHPVRYHEPLCQQGDTARGETIVGKFGTIDVCANCMRPVGDYRLLQEGKPDKFNGTSWMLMIEHHPYPPFIFKLSKDGKLLLPVAYDEEAHSS